MDYMGVVLDHMNVLVDIDDHKSAHVHYMVVELVHMNVDYKPVELLPGVFGEYYKPVDDYPDFVEHSNQLVSAVAESFAVEKFVVSVHSRLLVLMLLAFPQQFRSA